MYIYIYMYMYICICMANLLVHIGCGIIHIDGQIVSS